MKDVAVLLARLGPLERLDDDKRLDEFESSRWQRRLKQLLRP